MYHYKPLCLCGVICQCNHLQYYIFTESIYYESVHLAIVVTSVMQMAAIFFFWFNAEVVPD